MAKLNIEVKMISRETIKPSSPTPLHLKTFNLSAFDILYPPNVYAPALFFYQFLDREHDHDRRVRDLKSSLSQTLTRFYPLAGRIIENETFIDCNDDGADFIEAKVNGCLSDILKRPEPTFLSKLFPESAQDGVVLSVRVSLFECGGMAIGVEVSHKVADAFSLKLFVKGWANEARGGGDVVTPDLTALSSRFPASKATLEKHKSCSKATIEKPKTYKTTRFVFDSKSISALKTKATSVQRPSRVGMVTAHIWATTMKLSSRINTNIISHVLLQPIHLRNRIDPPLPENSLGNHTGSSFVVLKGESDDNITELENLVSMFRKEFENTIKRYAKGNDTEGLAHFYGIKDKELLIATSVCRFGFYEDSNFGWGEPVWLIIGSLTSDRNKVTLLDTKDGDGIEVWARLDNNIMDLLEIDQDFLQFASLNPSVDLR